MHHQLARTPRSSLRGWGSVNGDRSRTRDHGAVRCAVHLGGQQDDRRTSDFPTASRSVHRRRSPQLARPHGSTPIGDQGLGAGISRLSGFPSPTSSRGFPCALSCPLLRSTSRAGRAGREGRRPKWQRRGAPGGLPVTTCSAGSEDPTSGSSTLWWETPRQPRALPAGRGPSRWFHRRQRRAWSVLRPGKWDCRGTAAAGGQGSGHPPAVVMVRPVSADAVVCMS
jgi:hypothetical protein